MNAPYDSIQNLYLDFINFTFSSLLKYLSKEYLTEECLVSKVRMHQVVLVRMYQVSTFSG